MKLQNRTEYGVRALVTLAAQEGEILTIGQIAEQEGIPQAFLVQILATLRKAGIVTSVRGASGGFRLARPADQITLAEVVRVLEGGLATFGCVEENKQHSCERAEDCRTRRVWIRMTESLTAALDGLTLADVVQGA